MKVSIIIPVFNMADYLPRCMDSLLVQDLTDCEILLVDDGSTDGQSGPLCDRYAREYPSCVTAIHRENGGLGAARNTGLAAATGEYVLFVDSDDYVCPEMLETLAGYMEKRADVVIFRFLLEKDGVQTENNGEYGSCGGPLTLRETPRLLLAPPNACNKLWRRALFTENGIRFPEGIWYEDLAVAGKLLALAGCIFQIPEALYVYTQREGSITHSGDMARNLEIRDAAAELLDWFWERDLFSEFRRELEALTVRHVLMDASVRVLKMSTGSEGEAAQKQREVLDALLTFTEQQFPGWERNEYNRELSWKHRLVLALLGRRMYRLLKIIFR